MGFAKKPIDEPDEDIINGIIEPPVEEEVEEDDDEYEDVEDDEDDEDDENENESDYTDSDESNYSYVHEEPANFFFGTMFPNFNIVPSNEPPYTLDELLGFIPKPVFKKQSVCEMGRRKTNRAQNEKFLLSLCNMDQYNPKDEIFYNENKYGFTKVMKTLYIKPEVKESFIEGNDDIVLKNKNTTTDSNYKKLKRNTSPELAFKNLTSSQKSLFNQKSLPLTIINQLESEVVKYFSLTPNGIYTSMPLSNYHRILLHGIVRYYSLDAKSVNSRGHRSQKIVKVRNNLYKDFQPPQISLLKFVSSPSTISANNKS